jgi:lactoylglutathione lyase
LYVAFTSIFVHDQDRAKSFYRDVLGFEVRTDEPIGPDMRWVSLGIPGEKTEVVLVSPSFPNWSAEKVGQNTGSCLEVDDVFTQHQKWSTGGVEFAEVPRMEFYGGWASFKDSEGNVWGVHSPVRETAAAPQ